MISKNTKNYLFMKQNVFAHDFSSWKSRSTCMYVCLISKHAKYLKSWHFNFQSKTVESCTRRDKTAFWLCSYKWVVRNSHKYGMNELFDQHMRLVVHVYVAGCIYKYTVFIIKNQQSQLPKLWFTGDEHRQRS